MDCLSGVIKAFPVWFAGSAIRKGTWTRLCPGAPKVTKRPHR
jgi:hypothetical protein